ncbi:MAG: germination protein YpeB [Clostridia bacterium]|nr:germination protein YpeB [Clostridia bacterium]
MYKENDRNKPYKNQSGETQKTKDEKNPRNNNGLKITIVVMAFALIGLVVGMCVLGTSKSEDTTLKDASFQRAYFDLVAETNDIAVNMSKLDAANSALQQQQLLYEIWKNADLAEMSLASLSSKDSGVGSLIKFMNQTSDYCYFLALELKGEKTLTTEQEDNLKKLSEMLKEVNSALSDVQGKIENGGLEIGDESALSGAMGDMFEKFSETSVEYPQLIYDGPFSDGLADKETKGLNGDDIDEAKGNELVKKVIPSEKIESITFDGEWDTDIATMNYTVKIEGGQEIMVQLAKKGGSLLLLNRDRELKSPEISSNKAVDIAEKYLREIGYSDLQSVWTSNIGGIYYINLAALQNNVILYPDLIKVKIASDDGTILGVDAKGYAYNHIERSLETPKLSVTEAKAKVKSSLNANEGRLALIPYRTNGERLTYEFACEGDGLYFIYIDAVTGEEVNILFVIDSENGTLLM